MKTAEERFWEKVEKIPFCECWIWTASTKGSRKDGERYGDFRVSAARKVVAHRFSYEMEHGPIPDGLMVLHRCDNPPCVRPDHLFLGTAEDNADDMVAKGRQARGERNRTARLSEADVIEIRRLDSQGRPHAEIASLFGIDQTQVSAIARRKAWRHVGGDDRPLGWRPFHPYRAPNAKITAEQAAAIRALVAGGMRQVDAAAKYGIGQTNVSRIVRGESWASR